MIKAVLRLKPAVRAILRRFDLDVHRYTTPARIRRTRVLSEKGITLILDAGANTGQYAKEIRLDGYAGRILSFEPLSGAFSELNSRASSDDGWDCERLALSDAPGTAEINVAGNSFSSSLLPMLDRHVTAAPGSAYTGTESVRVERLDSILARRIGGEERLYLKLDVQGHELAVLKGADGVLDRLWAAEMELSVVPLYEGQPLLHEVVEHLYCAGFELVWLEEEFTDPANGDVLQLNGGFVRRRQGATPVQRGGVTSE